MSLNGLLGRGLDDDSVGRNAHKVTEHALARVENEATDAVPESEARKRLLSVEFWALIDGASGLISAIRTRAFVVGGFRQPAEAWGGPGQADEASWCEMC